jgi:hypothetical protein
MKIRRMSLFVACVGTLLADLAIAHHSTSEFDPNLPVTIVGTVSKLEWMSPHGRLHVDAVTEDGETVSWNFELPSPNTLMRRGWSRHALQPGDKVTVTGLRARNYPHIAIARGVTDAEGKALFSGSADPVY